MKNTFFLFLLVLLCGSQLSIAQTNKAVFTSFRDMESEYAAKTVFKAWKNETLVLPIRLVSRPSVPLTFNLKSSNPLITASVYQLHYVEGDISSGNCGTTKSGGIFEKRQFPDRAEKLKTKSFISDTATYYMLLELRVDPKTKAGQYPIEVVFSQGGNSFSAEAIIQVVNQKLPQFSSLNYKVDFWQFPMSVADFHKVKPWSDNHFLILGGIFDQLKGINQEVITTSVFWDLYNTSIKPLDEMMIQVQKKADGTYSYDYSNFEKYVSLGIQKGVGKQISVHNLFPWNNTFFYCNESSNQVVSFQSSPGTELYNQFWTSFLIDFSAYLKKKKWFDRVVMVVDERDINETLALAKFVQRVSPGLKMGYAGIFNSELSELIYDYSVPSNVILESADLAKRKSLGYQTTFYTSCFEVQPNLVIGSNLDDAYFLTLLSRSRGYDGMLRWAFNVWSPQIMTSAIFTDIPSGDGHFVYPGNQVSLRYLILKDALEDVLKFDIKQGGSNKTGFRVAQNRYFLLNNEAERMNMIDAMKSYLNE
jgi:hypothetical protein